MTATGHLFDPETSATIARRVRARVRRCWHNAAVAVHHLGDDAVYVEGWCVVQRRDPYVIEHGWCESGGRIVDPSYTDYVTRGISPLEVPMAYFPGMRFAAEEAAEALTQKRLPIAWTWCTPEYDHAFDAAWQYALTNSADTTPPERTRLVNCRREVFDVYIGRPSRWSNPYHIDHDGSRDEVIEKYREWVIRQPLLLRDIKTLRGQILGCDCPPQRCHGEVLEQLANFGR